jgi:hypothetical protein
VQLVVHVWGVGCVDHAVPYTGHDTTSPHTLLAITPLAGATGRSPSLVVDLFRVEHIEHALIHAASAPLPLGEDSGATTVFLHEGAFV